MDRIPSLLAFTVSPAWPLTKTNLQGGSSPIRHGFPLMPKPLLHLTSSISASPNEEACMLGPKNQPVRVYNNSRYYEHCPGKTVRITSFFPITILHQVHDDNSAIILYYPSGQALKRRSPAHNPKPNQRTIETTYAIAIIPSIDITFLVPVYWHLASPGSSSPRSRLRPDRQLLSVHSPLTLFSSEL